MDSGRVASARDVASEIERRLGSVGEAKLHKLLYYIQGYHLAWEGQPAYSEDIQAWKRGPVVAQLWRERRYRFLPRFGHSSKSTEALPESVRDITVNVICRLGNQSGTRLIADTHAEDPWLKATEGGSNIANQVISHQSLIDFFSIEPDWVRDMREHVATIRDDRDFVPDNPGALDAFIAKHGLE